MATTASNIEHKIVGGGFLLEATAPNQIFTAEDLTDEHRAIARTAAEFFDKEVAPRINAMQHGEHSVVRPILEKAAAIGLAGILIPERFGGMEMDLYSAGVVAEAFGRDGSFAVWFGGHTAIGTMPLLYFGNEEQKQRYLPKLAAMELLGAYCLSEPEAGSDVMGMKTRAELAPDGSHYVLNGQKMWISNGGYADLLTIFAKVGGEKVTAFLVERGSPGFSSGAEEKKMGLKGSSTTAIYLDNVKVPVENVLGEVGQGHKIAFNILNYGRLKLGFGAVGGSKQILTLSIGYAKQRIAFGKPIAEFGLIQHKLAEVAARIYAAESMMWRVAGMVEAHTGGVSWETPGAAEAHMKAGEEFAAECSYVKIFCSELLGYAADEGVQIYGGYGFHQDYAVERFYRDARVNRIFEGTNEINRMLAAGMLIRRAQQGRLGLVGAVKKPQGDIVAGAPLETGSDLALAANAKKVALLCLGAAYQRFGERLGDQQEILAGITDIAMNAFAMESAALRALKTGSSMATQYSALFSSEAMGTVESAAKTVLAASSEGDDLRMNLAVLRRFTKHDQLDTIALRRKIAARLIEAGRYVA